jgi:hypothetical protein
VVRKARALYIDPIYTFVFYLHWIVVLLALVGPFIAWGIGTLEFGHVPKPYFNDPKGMSPFASAVASYLFFLPLLGLFGFGVTGLAVTPVYCLNRWGSRIAWVLSICFAACVLIAFALYMLDPFRIGDWMLD